MKPGHGTIREPTIVLISIIAFCSVLASGYPTRKLPAIDFYQFWVVGQELAEGQPGNVFSDRERDRMGQLYLEKARVSGNRPRIRTARARATLGTFSTPFLYTVFSALSSGDYRRDLAIYRVLSLCGLVLSVGALCLLLGYRAAPTLAAITLFGSWFEPSLSDVTVGNVNHVQLGWLVLFLLISRKFPTTAGQLLGGFLLGLGAMFKPNTALVVGMLMAYWLVARQHRKLLLETAGVALGALTAFLWSSAVFGRAGIWADWFASLSDLSGGLFTLERGNYSPVLLLKDSMGIDAGWLMALACGGLALAAIVRGCSVAASAPGERSTPSEQGRDEILVVALAGIVTLLASPLSWLHYFVAAIPMLLITLRPMPVARQGSAAWHVARVVAIVALIAAMMRPLALLGVGASSDRVVLLCLATTALFILGLREVLALRDVASNCPAPGDASGASSRAARGS